ncbi:amastin-like surface protein-like protein [Trypanosoma theileri]|uniref:Amastin-like surface protein-like protein n=1 Tax=Trypanosoma theileri TaxID=67003 RepID=A0A1X0NX02_9TRYP|nr:amastin-like surface protein-like protein [Trypanosoma theileri]ORC88729.1 amastin-like surface protein-like protein [Trypanosoma theileri]
MGAYILVSKLLILCVLQGIVFSLILIATPLDVFRSWGMGSCYGLFGQKQCGVFGGAVLSTSWGCARRQTLMDVAAAFAIISILSSFSAAIMSVMSYFRMVLLRLSLFIIHLFICITLLITWACIASVYHEAMCWAGSGLGATHHYGPAFVMTVCAWVVQVFTVLLSANLHF